MAIPCALVDVQSGAVVAVIMADPGDRVPEGQALIEAPLQDGRPTIDDRWVWDGETFAPNAELAAELAASEAGNG